MSLSRVLKKIGYLVIISVVFSCAFHSKRVPVKSKDKIEVHGHRGARAHRPENSLPAFEYALREGVDVLEFDLVVTKDNVVIVTHDLYVNWDLCEGSDELEQRGDLAYRSLTLKQVKTLRCGVKAHPRFPEQELPAKGVKIPTLKEVFQFVSSSHLSSSDHVRFNIETKILPSKPDLSPSPKKFAQLVYDVIDEFHYQNRVILQSFDYRTLIAMKNIDSSIKTAQLTYGSFLDYAKVLLNQKIDYLSPHHKWLTKRSVQQLHEVGIRVVPWTANSPEVWQRLVQFNVDGIITDRPKALIEYLNTNLQ